MSDVINLLFQGTVETLWLSFVSCLLGLLLGLLLFFLSNQNKNPLVRSLAINLCLIIRSLPEILILFTLYFGSSALLSYLFHMEIEVPSFLVGATALSIIFGSYASKIFESANKQILKGEIEASFALGLTQFRTFYHIIWPQLWKYALPGLGNLWLILLKDTVLISLIGGYDLMSRTQILIHNTQEPFKYYILASCIYLTLTFLFEQLIKKVNPHDKRIA